MSKGIKIIISLILICVLLIPVTVLAEDTTSERASNYIQSYSAYITPGSGGDITIYFSITGTRRMTEIGSTVVYLYEYNGENTTLVQTFRYTEPNYAYMMGYDKFIHTGAIPYSGTSNHQYYAYVYFKAGDSTGSDTAMKLTSTVTA